MPDPFWSNLFRSDDDVMQRITDMWLQTPLFEGIDSASARQLIRNLHVREYRQNELIFEQGDQGAGAVLLLEGSVNIVSGDQVLTTLSAGDFFGEVALAVNQPRTASAIASSNVELVFLLKKDVEEWISRAPREGARLMSNVAAMLAHRLEQANRQNTRDQRASSTEGEA